MPISFCGFVSFCTFPPPTLCWFADWGDEQTRFASSTAYQNDSVSNNIPAIADSAFISDVSTLEYNVAKTTKSSTSQ